MQLKQQQTKMESNHSKSLKRARKQQQTEIQHHDNEQQLEEIQSDNNDQQQLDELDNNDILQQQQQPTSTKKPGILYISRIPPGMNPGGIKSLLMEHAPVSRIFLQPEDDSIRRRRKGNGGNGMERYVEGWAEFESKKDAKRIAGLLDGSRMGPKKGRRFYDDLWSLKYLSGFTWAHLTEKASRERKQREQMLRLEFAQAKKSDELYLQQLKKNKMVKLMDAKRHGADSAAAASLRAKAEKNVKQLQPISHKNKKVKIAAEPTVADATDD
jgi:ESF2/ABP1 family protein